MNTQEILDHYNSGKSTIEISKLAGESRHIISRILKDNNINLRGDMGGDSNPNKQIDIGLLSKLYDEGNSLTKLSATFGVSRGTLSKHLKFVGKDIKIGSILKTVDEQAIADEYTSGITLDVLCKKYKIGSHRIQDIITELNLTKTPSEYNKLSLDNNKIIELYASGIPSTEIAAIIDIDYKTVLRRLIENGAEIKNVRDYPTTFSKKERELRDYISTLTSSEILNNKNFTDYTLDIYLPELNLGFEFNGAYWHSTKFKHKNYHYNKTKFFERKGIRIVHIWEYDWDLKIELVKSLIKNMFVSQKIFARKCVIQTVNTQDAKIFCDTNHLQGNLFCKIYYGLYYNNELIQLMSFKYASNRWEIGRLCTKHGVSVIGGSAKLFSCFIKEHNPKEVFSYCDYSVFTGHTYVNLGFELHHISEPNFKYYNPSGVLLSREQCMKYKLIKNGADEKMTAEQIMNKKNFLKIYDCGNKLFIWKMEN